MSGLRSKDPTVGVGGVKEVTLEPVKTHSGGTWYSNYKKILN